MERILLRLALALPPMAVAFVVPVHGREEVLADHDRLAVAVQHRVPGPVLVLGC